MELSLRPMSPEVLAGYLATTFDAYRTELLEAGRSPEEADQNIAENVGRAFADGVPINGNELFSVLRGDRVVGVLWIAPRGPVGSWWIYDIELEPEFRGQGLGRATMLLAEAAVRERGGTELGLNVFGRNATARGLYESLGYEPTSLQMRKPLT
jgi:ribosomal protein S18 acetylase RimI-like enzyme